MQRIKQRQQHDLRCCCSVVGSFNITRTIQQKQKHKQQPVNFFVTTISTVLLLLLLFIIPFIIISSCCNTTTTTLLSSSSSAYNNDVELEQQQKSYTIFGSSIVGYSGGGGGGRIGSIVVEATTSTSTPLSSFRFASAFFKKQQQQQNKIRGTQPTIKKKAFLFGWKNHRDNKKEVIVMTKDDDEIKEVKEDRSFNNNGNDNNENSKILLNHPSEGLCSSTSTNHLDSTTTITNNNDSMNHNGRTTTVTKIPIVIGVDGGTESIRCGCFDVRTGSIIPGTISSCSYPTLYPQPSWAEQNPKDWITSLKTILHKSMDQLHSYYKNNDNEQQQQQEQYEPNLNNNNNTTQYEIVGICFDTTCCSVVAMNITNGEPLRPCILWMDQRSYQQSQSIYETCSKHQNNVLLKNCGGLGPISAEWFICKVLWFIQNEYELYHHTDTVLCEYQDYINYYFTKQFTASSCNAAVRWHWNGRDCITNNNTNNNDSSSTTDLYPGRPISMYEQLGIPELVHKLPKRCVPMGTIIGTITDEIAIEFHLPHHLPVIQGGADAFVGMIGLGCCIKPGQLCLITGSSHLHCYTTDPNYVIYGDGMWGPYEGVPTMDLNFVEGGQSSTGSTIRWIRDIIYESNLSYQIWDRMAEQISPGCDGLMAYETFQGSRTPITDPLSRGAFMGLTLSHTRIHLYRALLEAVGFGTRACIEGLEKATATQSSTSTTTNHEMIMAGGVTNSPLWLQMHADITNKTILVCENAQHAPLLGCAILASVGVGVYPNITTAVQHMVRIEKRIVPNPRNVLIYDKLYKQLYSHIASTLRPLFHASNQVQQEIKSIIVMENNNNNSTNKEHLINQITSITGGGGDSGDGVDHHEQQRYDNDIISTTTPIIENIVSKEGDDTVIIKKKNMIISPSLLACNWINIQNEIQKCLDCSINVVGNNETTSIHRFHIDIFDGVYIDSPYALTFGIQMIYAIRQQFPNIDLDIHLCVDRPHRFIEPIAAFVPMGKGTIRFIFQYEAVMRIHNNDYNDVMDVIIKINENGMKCGISINPQTPIESIYPILQATPISSSSSSLGIIDVVDVLAVEPGFGGQVFQPMVLDKIRSLVQYRDSNNTNNDHGTFVSKTTTFDIMVDGGVNDETVQEIVQAGADIIVAGSYLFQTASTIQDGIDSLQRQIQ